jgi:hypothetical protein
VPVRANRRVIFRFDGDMGENCLAHSPCSALGTSEFVARYFRRY